MLMSSCVIYTEETRLMYPEDPGRDYIIAVIFWLAIFWVIVGWWFLY